MYLVNSNASISKPTNGDVIRDFVNATEEEDNYLSLEETLIKNMKI